MSLKDLFGKNSEKIVSNKQLDNLYSQAESQEYIETLIEEKDRFLPDVDFSSASNFARYGSAERYYTDAIKNIYQNFPYDGSKKEKQEWRNSNTQFDLYVYDNIYPRTTGYVNLSTNQTFQTINISGDLYRSASFPQYITVNGGPNKAVSGKFEDSNIYDLSTNRESNLGISNLGNTVEFWFKNEYTGSNADAIYALFDLWNGLESSENKYARLLIEHSGTNTFLITYGSGSSGIEQELFTHSNDINSWNHYAFTFKNNSINTDDLDVNFYINGNLVKKKTFINGGNIALANNAGMKANIGAYRTNINANNNSWNGLGACFGSFDDFRFWKIERTSQQIYRNWHRKIGGGTNVDDANTNLGIYFKFNEGIVDASQINDLDKIILDYSGRVSNGTIVNYSLGIKNTGSAIDYFFNESLEEKDPIIFSSNPLVLQAIEEYSKIGREHDQSNASSIYKSIPTWVTEDAERNDAKDLEYLTQIISSYFDTLHIQIESLPKLKNPDYIESNKLAKTFAKNLLTSNGIEFSDIFTDASLFEDLFSASETKDFKEKLYDVKNKIYQNIYNNLPYIYKSKGTEKSLRNLIRCFGVDDDLIKINLYANGSTFELKDRYSSTITKKSYIDFNNVDRYEGYIYQKSTPGNVNTKGYLQGATDEKLKYIPLTFQAEAIFPRQKNVNSSYYLIPDFISSSIFGVHSANSDENNLNWGNDYFNFQVYAIKKEIDSPDVYFKITGSFSGSQLNLTSSWFKDVYDNQRWNFSVRIFPDKLGLIGTTSGSLNINNYGLDFIGINALGDEVQNQFTLSTTFNVDNMSEALKQNKRLYIGAHHENFNPNIVLQKSDAKISSARIWLDYLSNEELKSHAFEINNYGRQYANWSLDYIPSIVNDFSSSVPTINKSDTLVLDWSFQDVTSSDSFGQFYVKDLSSGSLELLNSYGLEWFSNYISYQYSGFGDDFLENDTQTVQKEYIFNVKKQNPEILNSEDLTQIVDVDDAVRTKDTKPYSYFIAIEKSMAQVVNDEILNWFATIKNFNNLIGDPVERYKQEYSGLVFLRRLFFEKVNSDLNFEKFLEFYKWIDSSITTLINQMLPASANMTDSIRNVIESHILERNKYESKLPSLEFKGEIKSYPIQSHLEYSYKEQAAHPNNLSDRISISRYYSIEPKWLKVRAIRNDHPVDTPVEPSNDIDREIIRQVINNNNLDKLPKLFTSEGLSYTGRENQIRNLTKTYRLDIDKALIVEDTISPVSIKNTEYLSTFEITTNKIDADKKSLLVQPIKKNGNYKKPYEYLQLSGRSDNNKAFVSSSGNLISSTSSTLNFTDNLLPERKVNKNIFVEKFSAPGGPEINSRGALDRDAEEYSAYNNLNYRNYRVRKQLTSWLAETKSIDSSNPSYHKVNRNAGFTPGSPFYQFVGGFDGNGPIPSYRITASNVTLDNFMGYLDDSGGEAANYNASEQQYLFIEPSGGFTSLKIESFNSYDQNDKLKIYYNPDPLITPELPQPFSAGGSSGWSDITLGLNQYVASLARINNTIYAGGRFSSNDTIALDSIGQWNSGSNLLPLSGGGVQISAGTNVMAVYASGTDLYVGGGFDAVGINALTTVEQPLDGWAILNTSSVTQIDAPQKIFFANNELYVAGMCNNTLKNGISKWNGNQWLPLTQSNGYYISGTINDVFVTDNYIYYAGRMRPDASSGDSLARSNVGRFNLVTNTYETFGNAETDILDFDYSSYVRCIEVSGSDVYIGLQNAHNYAVWKWNGSIWTGLGDDLTNPLGVYAPLNILDIALSGSTLYVGTAFNEGLWFLSSSASPPAWYPFANTNIFSSAKPNTINPTYGTSAALQAVSNYPSVKKIIVNEDGTIDIFGGFIKLSDDIGNVLTPLSGAAKITFDGSGNATFSQIGDGLNVGGGFSNPATDLNIHAVHYSGSDLYVGGNFLPDYSGSKMYKLTGTAWTPVNGSEYGYYSGDETIVYDFAFSGSKTFIVGNELYDYDNSNYNNVLQAGGNIIVQTPAISASNIAKYDTTTDTWSSLGNGLPGIVNAIIDYNGEIYAGGEWTDALSGNYISKFDGTSWQPVGIGTELTGSVNAFAIANNQLYVGALMDAFGSNGSGSLGIWNNISWRGFHEIVLSPSYADPLYFNGSVNALASYDNKIYIGGDFDQLQTGYPNESLILNHIGVFDSNSGSINALGNGLDDIVRTVAVTGNSVYAGGSFLESGTLLSTWNGAFWSEVGEGITPTNANYLDTILLSGSTVFIGGNYTTSSYSGPDKYGIGRYDVVSSYRLLASLSGSTGIDYSTSSIPQIISYPYTLSLDNAYNKILVTWVSDPTSLGDVGFRISWNTEQYIPSIPPVLTLTSVEKNKNYDNEFIVHQIPRSDHQYYWLTSSAVGFNVGSGFITQYDNVNYYSLFSILTASLSGTAIIDYAGLNTHIVKNIITSSNLITPSGNIGNHGLNKYISNINGPYQHPSWKQIRNVNNKIVELSRKNNYLIVQDTPQIKTKINNNQTLTPYIDNKAQTFTIYREPPVAYNRPMQHIISMSGSKDNIELSNTYDNNKEKFANQDLTKVTNAFDKQDLQTHDLLKKYNEEEIYDIKPEILEKNYTSIVYPAKKHVGLKESRYRLKYKEINGTGSNGYDKNSGEINNFWRSSILDRKRTSPFFNSFKTGSVNILNVSQISSSNLTASYFGMARNEFNTFEAIIRPQITASKYVAENYDSLFTLDSSSSIGLSFISSSNYFTNNYFISSSIMGDLAGFDEIDAALIVGRQSGTYFLSDITRSSGQQESVFFFKHDPNTYFVRPKPSYAYKIHYPSIAWASYYASPYSNPAISVAGVGEPFPPGSVYYKFTEYSASVTKQFINEGAIYKTNILSGKEPWYDTYEDYFTDLRSLSVNKSILPEYIFSKHEEHYIKDEDFTAPENYISYIGSDNPVNFLTQSYNVTDNLKTFVFDNDEEEKSIKFTIEGVKKLLPYKGFYPQERTAQIVGLFQKSFFNTSNDDYLNGYPVYKRFSITSARETGFGDDARGTTLNQQIQTLLQPYFAPGILFNTIKSGIAVDWPIAYPNYSITEPFYNPRYIGGLYRNTPTMHQTASFGNNTKNTRVIFLSGNYSARIPFESLIDLRGISSTEILTYMDPTRFSSETFIATDVSIDKKPVSYDNSRKNPIYSFNNKYSKNSQTKKFLDNRYSYAINNFLAETPRFFLKQQKLTNFTSKKQAKDLSFVVGKQYQMDVTVEKTPDFKMFLDFSGNYPYVQWESSGIINALSTSIPAASMFGPPTDYFGSSSYSASIYGHKAYDAPAYAPYTPPYYFGAQKMRIIFNPSKTNYSYEELVNSLTVSCFNATDEITDFFSSSITAINGIASPQFSNHTAYANRMPLTSSLLYNVIVKDNLPVYDIDGNIQSISNTSDQNLNRWRIQTKFETPILNFNTNLNKDVNLLNTTSVIIATTQFSSSASGGPYGLPKVTASYINNTSEIVKYGFIGMWSGYGITSSQGGVTLKLEGAQETDSIKNLADACGFEEETKYVGKIADEKEISEAIVMIPFTKTKNHRDQNLIFTKPDFAPTIKEIAGENSSNSYYFGVKRDIINSIFTDSQINIDFNNKNVPYQDLKNILTTINPKNSILKTMKAMTEYVIPPHLDWIYNREVDPFVMYIFEFKHKLLGNELADIWQGVMPQSAMQAGIDSVQIEHEFKENEFFHGLKIPNDVQWKIFKVKKRANYLYDSLVNGNDERFTFKGANDNNIAYSYNWPYDYFSLVELVNVDVSIKAKKKQ